MKIKPRTVKSEMIRETLYVRLADAYEDYAEKQGIQSVKIAGSLVVFVDLSTRVELEKGDPKFEPVLPTDDLDTMFEKFWKFCDVDYVWAEKAAQALFEHDKPLVEEALAREKPEEKN